MSAAANHTFPVLNPNIYLNFLPPATASQFEVARNIYLATLGALLWDMLVSLPEDLKLLRRPRLITGAYFLSRCAALGYVLQSVIAKTHRLPNCTAIELGVTICWVLATAASSFLFYQRVRAVYEGIPSVQYLFLFLLFANVGIATVVPIGSRSGPLAATGYCVNAGVKHYVAAATFARLVFDSCVFLAISYRVAIMHSKTDEKLSMRAIVSGDMNVASRLARAVLRGGQQYYLITVGSNILVSVLIVAKGVPPVYEAAFTIPDIALASSMACRVYRNLRFATNSTATAVSDNSGFQFKTGASTAQGLTSNGSTAADQSSDRLKSGLSDVEKGGSTIFVEIRSENERAESV